ncbi:FUSC family protein [Jatrophihabitans telluris]|uniref:FUSC family protein n=1 Tax=Jatrophihabitans telluris TaxID=2038343 RepID=A0ABY4R0K3_9ACTN|nr:FUSC family protein [Jatrophihabitans telluris]UQX89418.1 FUSC family protein [Jatrophihabitans telluris]
MRPMMSLLDWLSTHDPGYSALRRATRTAIVMPSLFALGTQVIGNGEVATFAAFGSFALLLLVDFSGPMRERLQAQVALSVAGAVLVCLATLASRSVWLAAASMTVVGFAVLFSGVVSSVLAGATTSLLLAFILPVSLPGAASAIPDRLAGWAMASAVSWLAIALLWPAPARDALRQPTIVACRALAQRLRADVAFALAGDQPDLEILAEDRRQNIAAASDAVAAVHRNFLATPYRPTGLSTGARSLVRLVDELNWLQSIVVQADSMPGPRPDSPTRRPACAVKLAAADVLDRGADLLGAIGASSTGPDALHQATKALEHAVTAVERSATTTLPVRRLPAATARTDPRGSGELESDELEFVSALDPSFRAQELSYAVGQIARNIDLTAAAERRGWLERLLGRQPAGIGGTLASAGERAGAHVERHSVWLHNSIRGAVGLGLAVFIANRTGVQHSFWVVLGTLSVLRSNALNTGQNVLRGLLGTVAGFVIGAVLLAVIGTSPTVLWVLLPIAILLAGVAPAAISFAAGQAAFTLTLVILFNIIQPAGWRIGLLRVEDIALGCAISLAVGLLFWPRGARAALRRALAEAYVDSAQYLVDAVEFGLQRCDPAAGPARTAGPSAEAVRAAAASRRLDDTFRGYLAERGAKPLPLSEVTSLVTGVAGLRLAADAVLDLWQRDEGEPDGDRAVARKQLRLAAEQVRDWYDRLAASLLGDGPPPDPQGHDKRADARLVEAVRHDLAAADGTASPTAVRMIWTAEHLDAARRLQHSIAGPARTAVAGSRFARMVP